MAAGTLYPVSLTPSTRSLLRHWRDSRSLAARAVRNARILLLRAEGVSYDEVCRRADCARATVSRICRLFCQGGLAALLTERPRGAPGRGADYSDADRERVREWAQSDPQALGLPVTRWSLAWLQRAWCRLLRRAPPALSTLRRWLRAEQRIPWYRCRTFCRSNDARYAEKLEAVCDAYLHAPDDWAVLCYDQKPHLQALSRREPNRPPQPGPPGQRPHDYKRNGTLDLHALYDTRSGRCRWSCDADHKGMTIARLLVGWLAARPEQKLVLVFVHLSANRCRVVCDALAELTAQTGKLVLFCEVPTYTSWANQIERVFAALQTELLDLAQACSVRDLGRQIGHWFRCRNATAQPFDWSFHPSSVMGGMGH